LVVDFGQRPAGTFSVFQIKTATSERTTYEQYFQRYFRKRYICFFLVCTTFFSFQK